MVYTPVVLLSCAVTVTVAEPGKVVASAIILLALLSFTVADTVGMVVVPLGNTTL